MGQGDFPELLPHHAITTKWSLHGDYYATTLIDGRIRIYDSTDLTTVIYNANETPIYGLAFNPDTSRLATGGDDGSVRIWDVTTGDLIHEFQNIGQYIYSIVWNPSGDEIWIFPNSGGTRIISVNGSPERYHISRIARTVGSLDANFKSGSTTIAAGGFLQDIWLIDSASDSNVRILDATPFVDIVEPPMEESLSITWHPTANIVANGKINGWIHVWNLDSPSDQKPMFSLKANDHVTDSAIIPFEYGVEDIIFSADGSQLKSISSDGTLRVWDAETGELLSDTNLGSKILSAAFSPDGNTLVYNTYSLEDVPPVILDVSDLPATP